MGIWEQHRLCLRALNGLEGGMDGGIDCSQNCNSYKHGRLTYDCLFFTG